nr:MAG: hypothetical protein [Bacteriophage sp.]
MVKRTNLDIRFNKASYIINQFSDSWEGDRLNLLPNFPKIKDMVSNHSTQENYLWLITYDLPNDLFDKIDNMGLVPYESITHEELTKIYYNQNFKIW